MTDTAAAGPELFSPGPKTATPMVLSRTLRRCLRYFDSSVNSNSSFVVFIGSLGFVCALGDLQLGLRAICCTVNARFSWRL